jgi:hypothetical protein
MIASVFACVLGAHVQIAAGATLWDELQHRIASGYTFDVRPTPATVIFCDDDDRLLAVHLTAGRLVHGFRWVRYADILVPKRPAPRATASPNDD